MTAYYNEIDPFAAEWLRELIKAGAIAPGTVDERSIEDVRPSDLRGFTQCHFFAGVGVWSYALRQSGWSDDRPVWSGSCPCQPFSAAGKGAGEKDERHLWPVFSRLIEACRPKTIFGEQVAGNLVTGKRVSAHLQRLWERKARLGILADWLEKDLSLSMQSVPEQDGARISADAQRFNGEQGIKAGGRCKITRSEKRTPIRADSGVGPICARYWSLRSNWDKIQFDGEPWMEYPLTGSGSGGMRVYERQHAGGLVRLERSLRELGRKQNDRDGERHHETPEGAIRRAATEADGEIERENGGAWIDTLQVDLEGMGYAFGCVPFPSASVGAPHIRDRAYWVADSASVRFRERKYLGGVEGKTRKESKYEQGEYSDCPLSGSPNSRMANASGERLEGSDQGEVGRQRQALERSGGVVGVVHTDGDGCNQGEQAGTPTGHRGPAIATSGGDRPRPTNGFWRDVDWLFCRDGKWRPAEPGTSPLVNGAAQRVGRLRGYGNAINAEAAKAFITAFMEGEGDD